MALSLALLNLYLVTLATAQGTCQVPFFPPLNSTGNGTFSAIRQYIIPTMNFTGCGVITDWAIVAVGKGSNFADRAIELQLFRPDPTKSTVFTRVSSIVVHTTHGERKMTITHTFTSIGFTFSPGDVLGFYYPSRDYLAVRYTTSFSTHSVLRSNLNYTTTNVFTLTSLNTEDIPLMSVSVSCKECSGRWSEGEVAGGAAGGALAVVLIVIGIALVAIISVAVCVRRKNVKLVFGGRSNSASHEPPAFTSPFHSAGTIVQADVDTYEMSDNTVYYEISDDLLDQKPCFESEKLGHNTTQFSREVPNDTVFEKKNICHFDPTYKPCEGYEYTEFDEIPKGREPLPLLPINVPTQSMYSSRVLTREERQRSTEPGSDENNIGKFPLVHFETLSRQKSIENSIPEAIYDMSFCEDGIYYSPSEDIDGIYAQMAQWGYQEIPRAGFTLSEKLGEGQFGEVYKAELKVSKERSLDVAVKLVKTGAPTEETTKFLQEAANLGQFKHRHVVRLIGVVTIEEPIMMLMELLPGGDLKDYLDSINTNPSQLSSPDLPSLLLQFCKQVVDGLACLSRKSFVHRDIAARNILLDKDFNCKISDFGMTKVIAEDNYYILQKGTKIPAKWTSPEALLYRRYSTSSDVWSYGMLMYEIWSLGHKPFEDKTVQEMIECFDDRYCHPPPPGCPRAVYEVMVNCWNPSHNDRPSASDISGEFCKSERILLFWKKEDIVSPSAQVLGGPLSEGEELYKDLQLLYRDKP